VTATVNVAGTLPGSTQLAAGMVGVVEHVTGADTPGYTGSGVILGEYEFTLDENGTETLYFEECVDDLEGTVYEVHIAGKVVRIQPTTAGTWLLGDPAIAAPPGLPPVAYTPPELIDPDAYGIDTDPGLATTGRLKARTPISPRWDHGAANNGSTDDSVALQAAIDQACSTGRPLLLEGLYAHASTLTWAHTQGALRVIAHKATITYTGSSTAWLMTMNTAGANQPSVFFEGGNWVGTASGVACFYSRNLRLGVWRDVQVEGYTNGKAWWPQNVGYWSERNYYEDWSSRNNERAFHFDCHELAVTEKTIASGVATLTVGTHLFQVGNRVLVALDTPDPDYDSDLDLDYEGNDLTLTAVTATTISYATGGADEAPVATTGTVTSKGSFKLTRVGKGTVSGGTVGEPLIECHLNAGPYDSFFDHISGNVPRGVDLFKLSRTTWRGTTIMAPSLEVSGASGTTHYFTYYSAGPPRPPRLIGAPHIPNSGTIALNGTEPTTGSMFYPDQAYGGIDTADFVATGKGFVNRILSQATFPILSDISVPNPDDGTEVQWEDTARNIYEKVVRTDGGGLRGMAMRSMRTTEGTAAPASGTWARGDICWNTAPSVGAPAYWVCVTAGTPGTWAASPNLV
jgi:hypothetical protein